MICTSSSPLSRCLPGEGRGPRGFTLVELLVVILILAVLTAFLLPALNAALRTAKNAAVGSEINQLAQALASFKAKYGDYPPSRIYLAEDGNYNAVTSNVSLGSGDITVGQLAQRSLAALRKFFPRVSLSTSGPVFVGPNYTRWYDFNGNGGTGPDRPYILQGHECLVFFLGGIPLPTGSGFGMTGFGKDPTNPFSNSLAVDPNYPNNDGKGTGPSPMYSNNRQAPLFEFAASRLALDPYNPARSYPTTLGLVPAQIPGCLDSLGNSLGGGLINFYAYFSAYGNGGYDPNDVNFVSENHDPTANTSPELQYRVNFPIPGANPPNPCISFAPNPYTSTLTLSTTALTTFLNPQSFQIISSGIDGTYGVGGQYSPDSGEALPYDITGPYLYNTIGNGIRISERDNVTNFHNGKLQ